MSMSVGQSAPLFEVSGSIDSIVSLAGYRGKKTALLFSLSAFMDIRTSKLCNIRDNIAHCTEMNAQVVNISTSLLSMLVEFKEGHHLNFPLSIGHNKKVPAAYNSLYSIFPAFNVKKVSECTAFVTDSQGITVYSEVCPTPGNEPGYEAILSALQCAN